MELDEKTLNFIFDSNIEVQGYAYAPWGFDRVHLNAEDFKQYISDHEAFCAQHFEASLPQYRAWMASHGASQCGGMTKKGKRCKNKFGGYQLRFSEWLANEGELCLLHMDLGYNLADMYKGLQ